MQNLLVRLTPWAKQRIITNYGSINKTTMRKSLRDFPDTEFHTVWTPTNPRDGQVVTTREAFASGVDELTLRYNDDRNMMTIVIHHTGDVVVR